jgi:hypothetical protein
MVQIVFAGKSYQTSVLGRVHLMAQLLLTRRSTMEAFAVRDLREHTGELVRNAEGGRLSVVSKHGKP